MTLVRAALDPTAEYLRSCRDVEPSWRRATWVDSPTASSRYATRALSRPLFAPHATLSRLGDDLRRLAVILHSMPERCFGGDLESYLAAQGQPSRLVEAILRGSTGSASAYGRADAVRTADGFRVVEFNIGSEVGGVDSVRINHALLEHGAFRAFAARHRLGFVDPAAALAAHLRAASADVVGVDDPLVGLIEETGSARGCAEVAVELRRCGIRTVIGELGELSGAGRKVVLRERFRLDVVLRYFFAEQVPDERDGLDTMDLLRRAHGDGHTAFFAPLDAETVGNKAALALLFRDEVWSELTEDERALVRRLVPRIRLLGADFRIVGTAERRELLDECVARRAELVLKPAFGSNGRRVLVGAHTAADDWQAALRSPGSTDLVVQEQVVPEIERVHEESGAVGDWIANWGVFVGDSGYGGAFARALPAGQGGGVVGGSAMTRYGAVFGHQAKGASDGH